MSLPYKAEVKHDQDAYSHVLPEMGEEE